MEEQKCKKCGAEVEGMDMDKPADFFYCECGHSWCDTYSWAERMAAEADSIRKAIKEGDV
jgi:transcription initiation factor IIE alpha subunit|tara:strand:- start:1053 stop:1232 length:180 start_codon:yes stop_codon:yes gene_type:complete